MWAVQITNADCSWFLKDDPAVFENDLDLFDTLHRDFEVVKFVEKNEHGLLCRLYNTTSYGTVYVIVYEMEN